MVAVLQTNTFGLRNIEEGNMNIGGRIAMILPCLYTIQRPPHAT
jgi:hypothetical protein